MLEVSEGSVAVLTCRVYGVPRPMVIWQKGEYFEDVEHYHNPRMTVLDNGDLEIQVCNSQTNCIICYLLLAF